MQIISVTEKYKESFEGRRQRQRTSEAVKQDKKQARRIAERLEERKSLDCLVTDLCREGKWEQATDVENIYSGEREADARAFHAEFKLVRERRERKPPVFDDSLLAQWEPLTPAKFARFFDCDENTITRALCKWWNLSHKEQHKGHWSLKREQAKIFLDWYVPSRHKKRHPPRKNNKIAGK